MAKKQNQDNAPSLTPPPVAAENISSMGGSQPIATSAQLDQATQTMSAPMPEALIGNQSSSSDDQGFGAGIWHNNKKITALWSINETRNAWAAITDLGWIKLTNNSDSVIVALNLLASHARDRDRSVNVRIDNNQVVEIYVW